MLISVTWALVALVLFALVNYRYGQWQAKQASVSELQVEVFNKRVTKLEDSVSRLHTQRGFDE